MNLTPEQISEIVSYTEPIIYRNEGDYHIVNADDGIAPNNSIAIGKCQWFNIRALALLKNMIKADRESAISLLGESLTGEFESASNLTGRTVNSVEKAAISNFISTPLNKVLQDTQSKKDVTGYVNIAIEYGLTDPRSIVYCADLINKYGNYSAMTKNITVDAIKNGGDFEAFNAAAVAVMGFWCGARVARDYEACKKIVFSWERPGNL